MVSVRISARRIGRSDFGRNGKWASSLPAKLPCRGVRLEHSEAITPTWHGICHLCCQVYPNAEVDLSMGCDVQVPRSLIQTKVCTVRFIYHFKGDLLH